MARGPVSPGIFLDFAISDIGRTTPSRDELRDGESCAGIRTNGDMHKIRQTNVNGERGLACVIGIDAPVQSQSSGTRNFRRGRFRVQVQPKILYDE